MKNVLRKILFFCIRPVINVAGDQLVRTKNLRIVTKPNGEVAVYSDKINNPHYTQALKIGLIWPFVVYGDFLINAH